MFFGVICLVLGMNQEEEKIGPVVEMYKTSKVTGAEMPVFYVETDRKAVAFTFDISWGDKVPDKILDVLKEYGLTTTFFLSGPWAKYYEEIVKRIVDEGHEIASHGQEHIDLSPESRETIYDNIKNAHNILTSITKTSPQYFRPPNGDYDDLVINVARELGYETIIWAVDSRDWMKPGAAYIVDRVTSLAFPGAIILFHASDSAVETPEALPGVVDFLRAEGYEIMTLGELMSIGTPSRHDPR